MYLLDLSRDLRKPACAVDRSHARGINPYRGRQEDLRTVSRFGSRALNIPSSFEPRNPFNGTGDRVRLRPPDERVNTITIPSLSLFAYIPTCEPPASAIPRPEVEFDVCTR